MCKTRKVYLQSIITVAKKLVWPVYSAPEGTEWLRTVQTGSLLEPETAPPAAGQQSQKNHPVTSTKIQTQFKIYKTQLPLSLSLIKNHLNIIQNCLKMWFLHFFHLPIVVSGHEYYLISMILIFGMSVSETSTTPKCGSEWNFVCDQGQVDTYLGWSDPFKCNFRTFSFILIKIMWALSHMYLCFSHMTCVDILLAFALSP